jgi:hypothetical protein
MSALPTPSLDRGIEDFADLVDRQSVAQGSAHVQGELVPVAARHQGGQGDRAPHGHSAVDCALQPANQAFAVAGTAVEE